MLAKSLSLTLRSPPSIESYRYDFDVKAFRRLWFEDSTSCLVGNLFGTLGELDVSSNKSCDLQFGNLEPIVKLQWPTEGLETSDCLVADSSQSHLVEHFGKFYYQSVCSTRHITESPTYPDLAGERLQSDQ